MCYMGQTKHYASKLTLSVSVSPVWRFPTCWIGGFAAQEYSEATEMMRNIPYAINSIITNDRVVCDRMLFLLFFIIENLLKENDLRYLLFIIIYIII